MLKKESNAMFALKEVVELMGAKVCIVGPEEHDRIVARTSHIPHLSAALLVNLIAIDQDGLMDYVGGGLEIQRGLPQVTLICGRTSLLIIKRSPRCS